MPKLAIAVADTFGLVPAAVPVDDNGVSKIPELRGRAPTWNESILIGGDKITMASTNVEEIWWNWSEDLIHYNPKLWVKFLDGSLYVYKDVPLSVAVGMVQTASPGRYVWNVLRVGWPTPSRAQRVYKGTSGRKRPQVVRLVR